MKVIFLILIIITISCSKKWSGKLITQDESFKVNQLEITLTSLKSANKIKTIFNNYYNAPQFSRFSIVEFTVSNLGKSSFNGKIDFVNIYDINATKYEPYIDLMKLMNPTYTENFKDQILPKFMKKYTYYYLIPDDLYNSQFYITINGDEQNKSFGFAIKGDAKLSNEQNIKNSDQFIKNFNDVWK